jgi:hypothetical protein
MRTGEAAIGPARRFTPIGAKLTVLRRHRLDVDRHWCGLDHDEFFLTALVATCQNGQAKNSREGRDSGLGHAYLLRSSRPGRWAAPKLRMLIFAQAFMLAPRATISHSRGRCQFFCSNMGACEPFCCWIAPLGAFQRVKKSTSCGIAFLTLCSLRVRKIITAGCCRAFSTDLSAFCCEGWQRRG